MSSCDTCHKNDAIGFAAMPGVPMSFAYCRECLNAGAHPYNMVVANTALIGGMASAADWWIALVDATLKHLGKSRTQFDEDVEKALSDLQRHCCGRGE
jgi:hypothetical protein